MGLLSAAFAALLAMLAADAHRTTREANDAELRQMLLAASAQINQQIPQWGDTPPAGKIALELPQSLQKMEAAMHAQIARGADNSADVEVVARLGKQTSRQILHYTKRDGRWMLDKTQLVQ